MHVVFSYQCLPELKLLMEQTNSNKVVDDADVLHSATPIHPLGLPLDWGSS